MKLLPKLTKIIDDFPIKKQEATSLLIQVSAEDSVQAQLVLTKNLTDRGFKVIVLSGGRPCKDLISMSNRNIVERLPPVIHRMA